MNPIETAVAPLKDKAVTASSEYAKEIVRKVYRDLEAADWDAKKVAPYPDSFRMGKKQYHEVLARYKLVRSLTKSVNGSRSMRDPEIVEMSQPKIDHFVESAEKMAAAQYEAYVGKLNHKIGEVKEAKLVGSAVWQHSILEVKKADGTSENWKTQMILNVSKLGTVFNQWPTRKVK